MVVDVIVLEAVPLVAGSVVDTSGESWNERENPRLQLSSCFAGGDVVYRHMNGRNKQSKRGNDKQHNKHGKHSKRHND